MHYSKFEDIPVWQESRKIVNEVYRLIAENQKLSKDYSLCDQIKRAAYSIMLNIAEGFERSSNKEFANYINISKGSAGEVRSILYIMVDNKYIDKKSFDKLYHDLLDISSQLSNFRKYLLKNSTYKK